MNKTKIIEGQTTDDQVSESGLVVGDQQGIVSLTTAMSSKDLKAAVKLMNDQRQIIRDFVSQNLIDGVDFGKIKATSKSGKEFESKPTLYKPGMEKILSLFGLASELEKDIETLEMTDIKNAIAFKCNITRNGQKIAEGRGAAVVGDMGRDLNATIKIAEKRARMDACLSLGFSEYFTQDMDDPEYKKDRASSYPNNQPVKTIVPGPMTTNQRKMIFSLMKKAGITETETQKAVFDLNCPHQEGQAVTSAEASEFINKLQTGDFKLPDLVQTEEDVESVDVEAELEKAKTFLITEDTKAEVMDKIDSLGLSAIGRLRLVKEVSGKTSPQAMDDGHWMALSQRVDGILSGREELPSDWFVKETSSKTKDVNVSEDEANGTDDTESKPTAAE